MIVRGSGQGSYKVEVGIGSPNLFLRGGFVMDKTSRVGTVRSYRATGGVCDVEKKEGPRA